MTATAATTPTIPTASRNTNALPEVDPGGDSRLPDFFCIGAYRSGTTWLYEALRRTPGAFLPDWKELNFFNRFDGRELYVSHGLRWYTERYRDAPPGALRGDISPGYFVDPMAPARIHRHAPAARLILLVREPVERTHSHYWYVRRERPDLSYSLLNLLDHPERDHYGIIESSLYAKHLGRYLDCFPREHIHVVNFEDIVEAPDRAYERICGFLGLRPELGGEDLHRKVNPARRVRWKGLNLAIRRLSHAMELSGFGRLRRTLKNSRVVSAINGWNLVQAANPPLDAATEAALTELYSDEYTSLRRMGTLDAGTGNAKSS